MKKHCLHPPNLFLKFFRWYCHPKLLKYIEGDLMELYEERVLKSGKFKADLRFIADVILLCRPGIIRPAEGSQNINTYGMYKSYFKIGIRTLLKNKGYSIINIGGLVLGMTVAILIGLWVHDELTFNEYHQNHDSIAQAWSFDVSPETQEIRGGQSIQYPVGLTLRTQYPQYFKQVLMAWWIGDVALSTGDEKFMRKGQFIEPGVLEMLSLKMLQGTYRSLDSEHSIVLSKSAAGALFGGQDPLHKIVRLNNNVDVEVTGVYEDIPRNSRFHEVQFFAPWSLWLSQNRWAQGKEADWDNRPFNIYVQLQPNVSMETVNEAIRDIYSKNVPADFYKTMEKFKPTVQLVPMNTWHLYSEFKDGKPSGGRITYVWLVGIVGVFVLLLACINFINLSTARSEKRAKEVGIRKTIGSARGQLVMQFLSESFIVVMVAFLLSMVAAGLLIPWFGELADKDFVLPFTNPFFWIMAVGFIAITGFTAGVYPAFYLSAFKPVSVLKSTLRLGRLSALPRQMLVVVQFTVSIVLIIGTAIVYQQIQFARNRSIGYDRNNLVTLELRDPDYNNKLNTLRTELLQTGAVLEAGNSSGPLTAIQNVTSGYSWPGKDPGLDAEFAICNITQGFGKTVGWEFAAGRDFSKEILSDSTDAIIINEAAVRYMGLKDPVGKEFVDVDEFGNRKWSRTIIGVVKDLVMESPYEPVMQTLYFYHRNANRLLHVKLNPEVSLPDAVSKIRGAVRKVLPNAFFDYHFVDEVYANKFSQEERIGKLAGIFAMLAIFISCLGLFGLASFVAEQRMKEIGIRKVVGASVFNLWKLLSRDFVVLTLVSCLLAVPVAYYLMAGWLEKYTYRTEISEWMLLMACLGALLITMLTVSFQSIRAAKMNPVNSLRSE